MIKNFAALAATAQIASASIFADLKPKAYRKERELDIHVGNLISKKSMISNEFYTLNYCDSLGEHHYQTDEIAEAAEAKEYIHGVTMYETELHESFFLYRIGQNKLNAAPCHRTLTDLQYDTYIDKIEKGYGFKLYLDGLPSATIIRDPVTGETHKDYFDGIPIGKHYGTFGDYSYVLYNHWIITVKTQAVEDAKHQRIVGFEVEPRSYANGESVTMDFHEHIPLYLN